MRRVCKLSEASPEVLYTLRAESPFHNSTCLDGIGCATSLGDTVHVVAKGWVSMTSALERSTWWPMDHNLIILMCRCSHIPVLKCPSVLRQPVLQAPARLPNVHSRVI